MRLKSLSQVQFFSQEQHRLIFHGERGEQFSVEVLEQDIVRVRHLPDGDFRLNKTWTIVSQNGDMPREGRLRNDDTPFTCPPMVYSVNENQYHAKTEKFQFRITLYEGCPAVSWYTLDDELFAEDMPLRAYEYDHAGRGVSHVMKLDASHLFYGFGEKSGTLNKRGMRLEMKNLDALGYSAVSSDPLYKHFPFYITYVPDLNLAYGLFYDNFSTTVFDMGREIDALWGSYRRYDAQDGDLDYYMIYGATIQEVIEKYTGLIGRPFLPPKYSLGYLGSTMSYTEAPDAQNQLAKFVHLLKEHRIPCDLFHLSSGYTTDENGKRCVFTWNHDRVPQPKVMVEQFHQSGVRLAANVKPYLLNMNSHYDHMAAQNGFLYEVNNPQEPVTGMFWSGQAYEHDTGGYLDFTNPQSYDWWKTQLHQQIFHYGIDVVWNDNNEFGVWDDAAQCHGFGEAIDIGLIRPIQTLLMNHASYHATTENRPDERPFMLTRSGCPGMQRYAQSWSGDNATSWETLKYNIPMGLGMGLSGAPNTGHDVGGFYGEQPDPELFLRWVQNGIFHPRFTIHSWNSDGTVNEPWMHPEVLPYVREAIEFRYRLIPYLYALFFESYETGHPIIRPMVYQFTSDALTHENSFDFMLGDWLLVPSVFEPHVRTRDVYLPQNTHWYDFHTGQQFTGGQLVTVDAPLSRFPLLVLAGGMIPMRKDVLSDNERVLFLFPHPQTAQSETILIEDDGISLDYQQGGVTKIHFTLQSTPSQIEIQFEQQQSGYTLPYSYIECVLPVGEQRPVMCNGQSVDVVMGEGDRPIFEIRLK